MKDIDKKQRKKLAKEQKEIEKFRKKRRRARNREYRRVSYFFAAIFISLAGYLIYFDAVESESFINSPYNTRQDTFADRVVRGSIVAAGGEVLAETQFDWEGEEYRNYPYGNMFAHVVGYDTHGKMGLESEGNFQLLTSHEFFLEQMKNQLQGEKNMGDTLLTSLDVCLQSAAYYALGDNRGAVVAMEPSTGRILAMVSKSDFNPNTLAQDWDYLIQDESNSSLLNRATLGQYPPGSTFKIVTALDYFRERGSMEGFSYNCEGTITREDYTLQCYDATAHGQEDLHSAFADSCNCAFAQIGMDLGVDSLRSTAESLLFNKKLPLDTDYQISQFSLNRESKVPLIMQTSIGQGDTLVSPMHMALITSAIANDGVMMKPSLIDGVNNAQGEEVSREKPESVRRIMTAEEAEALKGLMTEVVDSGTAYALGGRDYAVAGKTGSAEIDSEGNSHSWFVGFSGTENPDLAVSIIVEYGGTGSQSAVPIAAALFDAYYYG